MAEPESRAQTVERLKQDGNAAFMEGERHHCSNDGW